MNEPIILLFEKPPRPRPAGSASENPLVGVLLLPITVPLLLVGAAISFPWGFVQKALQDQKERAFAARMKSSGRLMAWNELESAIADDQGTFIGEWLSIKGPFRLWWTSEDIPSLCPYKYDRGHHTVWGAPEFAPFFEWCHARYTNPQSGVARLVNIPKEEQKGLKDTILGTRFVSTCSFSVKGRP